MLGKTVLKMTKSGKMCSFVMFSQIIINVVSKHCIYLLTFYWRNRTIYLYDTDKHPIFLKMH